jgi:hypothetical protein
MGYWSVLHRDNPVRFEHEISRLAGTNHLDLPNCFNVLLDSWKSLLSKEAACAGNRDAQRAE